jgi:predicted porin
MDMFGGLKKTSSHITIAAALGLTLGGLAFKATPAQAADLGGDCCADLEERVAELEATTVRKGNKKVSVTISGWVVKSINWWDDGDIDSFAVGDKDADLASRFAITGSAQIAPGWSAGYNLTVVAPGGNGYTNGGTFGILGNQYDEFFSPINHTIRTLYSYIYIKSDTLGTLNWGYLSPASDNPAVLADISGTVIESNAVFFEGAGFRLRPGGTGLNSFAGLSSGPNGPIWFDFLTCSTNGGVGADCFGAPRPAVRYDSPTWGGFRFETSYGTVENSFDAAGIPTPDNNFWDIAVFYTADWNSIKLSAAYAFTHTEGNLSGSFDNNNDSAELHQVGASILHKPTGLGIYGLYQQESVDGNYGFQDTQANDPLFDVRRGLPDTDVWYVKPFWRKAWSPIGATVLYGEYGEYNDQFGAIAGFDLSNSGVGANSFNTGCQNFDFEDCYVTGSEVQRWGLGLVQEIDSAAMHLWIRWQHQELDVDFAGFEDTCNNDRGCRVNGSFDDWDLFQAGGVIFF